MGGPILEKQKKLPQIQKSWFFSMHFTLSYPKADNLGVAEG